MGHCPKNAFGIRADCDGLPIKEKKQDCHLPQQTETCLPLGHDAHTAMALGVAPILWNYRNELKGTEKYYDRLCEICKHTAAGYEVFGRC